MTDRQTQRDTERQGQRETDKAEEKNKKRQFELKNLFFFFTKIVA